MLLDHRLRKAINQKIRLLQRRSTDRNSCDISVARQPTRSGLRQALRLQEITTPITYRPVDHRLARVGTKSVISFVRGYHEEVLVGGRPGVLLISRGILYPFSFIGPYNLTRSICTETVVDAIPIHQLDRMRRA